MFNDEQKNSYCTIIGIVVYQINAVGIFYLPDLDVFMDRMYNKILLYT
jgi:hypothetical protein